MSTRVASWLAWSLCALSLVLTALGLLFHILNLSEPSVPTFAHWVESTLMGVGASTVGAIIASRRIRNPIGWLLCAAGLAFGSVMFASEYAIYALLVAPGSLPAGEALGSVNPLWVLGFNLFVLMLILFPTAVTDDAPHSAPEVRSRPSFLGRLRSERGGLVSWSSGVRLTVQVLEEASSVDKGARTNFGSLDRAGVNNFVDRAPREPCDFRTLGVA